MQRKIVLGGSSAVLSFGIVLLLGHAVAPDTTSLAGKTRPSVASGDATPVTAPKGSSSATPGPTFTPDPTPSPVPVSAIVFKPAQAGAADKLKQVLGAATAPQIAVVLPGTAVPVPQAGADPTTARATLPNLTGARLCLKVQNDAPWKVKSAFPSFSQKDVAGYQCSGPNNLWPPEISIVLDVS